MPHPVAVIIPALNEESSIARAIASAAEAGAAEIVVADGGSIDRTAAIARDAGAMVVTSPPFRAVQMNRGARASSSEILVFLHADSELPPAGLGAAVEAIRAGMVFGGFRLAFLEPDRSLSTPARLINLRSRLTRCPWGDQAQFIARATFEREGGFPEIPLMEDYEMARRMRRRGPTVILSETVATSGRRFLAKGNLRTAAINWSVIAAYHLGVDPRRLAKWYRGG